MSRSKISAKLVAASRSDETTIWTLNIKYGLIVHAELLRHKLLSHSVKSNRAIEPHRIRKEVLQDPYIPVRFGENQRGMIAKGVSTNASIARKIWLLGRYPACALHWCLDKLGIHKEVCNRVLNPWQWVRQTITFTEYENLFNLRLHEAAQFDIKILVQRIQNEINVARETSTIVNLKPGEWHTPYVKRHVESDGVVHYYDNDGTELSVEQAIQCSIARCARSSYDNHDGTKSTYNTPAKPGMRTDKELYESLLVDRPIHASPAEHVATPMKTPCCNPLGVIRKAFEEPGITHIHRRSYKKWSGNLRGWIAYRYLIDDEATWGFEDLK